MNRSVFLFCVALLSSARPGLAENLDQPACTKPLTISDLPDPFAVNGENTNAVLAFVDRVAPLAKNEFRDGLPRMFARLWRLYRADLTQVDIQNRVDQFRFSRMGLFFIRHDDRNGQVEVGRLRWAWYTFLGDLDGPKPGPFLIHRARALGTIRQRQDIVKFLSEETGAPVKEDSVAVGLAIEHLLARATVDWLGPAPRPSTAAYGPNSIIPQFRDYVEAINPRPNFFTGSLRNGHQRDQTPL